MLMAVKSTCYSSSSSGYKLTWHRRFKMHFGLFITGVTMLFGSLIIVFLCKYCRRKSIQKHADEIHHVVHPTVTCIVEGNSKTSEYLKTLTPKLSPKNPHKHSEPRSVTSIGSGDSREILLTPKSPRWLTVPKPGRPRHLTPSPAPSPVLPRPIPSIYIESGCYSNSTDNATC